MRYKIFKMIELAEEEDVLSKVYDFVMMTVITISLLPIAFQSQNQAVLYVEAATTIVFIIDYILRLLTADYKLRRGKKSFLLYPVTPMAIIDILAILPSVLMVSSAFRVLKVLRLFTTFRAFRIFKWVRYSKNINMVLAVFRKQKEVLLMVCALAVGYIVVCALIMMCIEPENFPNFIDAVYWSAILLTTVGYGDIIPLTVGGKIITVVSSLFGVAIVALPAGIITAGYMSELKMEQEREDL